MISVADAVIYEPTVVVEAFHALVARVAMDGARRPDGPAEEAEVVDVSVLLQGFI